jgi:signal transduction histidine kinase
MLARQILSNIFSNAIEHGINRDVVQIHIEKTANQAVIYIEDHGPGIDPNILKTIFTGRQYTESGPTYRGNGLYLSKRFAIKMKGDLSIESTLNRGTKVTVTLPIKDS